ncbi:MAG: diaminopropionate ammonia-lyase [Acidimicrobiales bacterium]
MADPTDAQALYRRCPVAAATPLVSVPQLARDLGIGELWLKDERGRMGLGSFKALGAAHAIARLAAHRVDAPGAPADQATMATALAGTTFVCASAGNHGLSVAAAAPVFGATAVIHLARTVPEAFADRLRARGARVVRSGDDYEASMSAAMVDADAHGWTLLSDSSWAGYVELPTRVMEGYLIMAAEVADAMADPPTHVFVQCGVGGLAAAVTALVRARWGAGPAVVVVEPSAAPALLDSIAAGRPVTVPGPVSSMGRLDCKEPSHLALAALASDADHFVTVTDEQCDRTVAVLGEHGMQTTPSGAAGVAGPHHAGVHREALGVSDDSRVLAFITEGPEEDT